MVLTALAMCFGTFSVTAYAQSNEPQEETCLLYTSYAEASDDDKAVIFELYCRLVNYFGPTVGFQLSVVCYYPDMAEYRKILRIPPTGDSFDPIRKEFSDMLLSKALSLIHI